MAHAVNYNDLRNTDFESTYRISGNNNNNNKKTESEVFLKFLLDIRKRN